MFLRSPRTPHQGKQPLFFVRCAFSGKVVGQSGANPWIQHVSGRKLLIVERYASTGNAVKSTGSCVLSTDYPVLSTGRFSTLHINISIYLILLKEINNNGIGLKIDNTDPRVSRAAYFLIHGLAIKKTLTRGNPWMHLSLIIKMISQYFIQSTHPRVVLRVGIFGAAHVQ
ncbi:hypothetical protein LG200_05255 [Methylobacillus caricis]|uniref:hypothetical protein n=1 Tax=Methylobacillus caricis TaxID=1971611 RepID=UPI001CFF92BD|nr:hypothetical protein [Methylobacillus caricis]MCB5187412.1 hypothetical protein [Methylobacillus caricis]